MDMHVQCMSFLFQVKNMEEMNSNVYMRPYIPYNSRFGIYITKGTPMIHKVANFMEPNHSNSHNHREKGQET